LLALGRVFLDRIQVFHDVLEILLATGAFELVKLHTYVNKSSEEK
jgi:hypothetical protein